ncbi:MAG: hypothetical protein WCT77_08035, partial [Bacteroidota bacterium]|jgi:hypothetical protein
MNNAITSLSILKVHWDEFQKDYIDNFVPFVGNLISIKDYTEIKIENFIIDFEKEYGLKIPYFAMKSILIRAKNNYSLIKEENHQYIPNIKQNPFQNFAQCSKDQLRKHNKIISELIKFSKDKYNKEITENEADDVIIKYLKKYDIDIVFLSTNSNSLLPNVSPQKELLYIFNNFIIEINNNEPMLFNHLLEITIGHMVSNTILYEGYQLIQGNLNKVTVFVDTPILIKLFGLEGPERANAYSELFEYLKKNKVTIKVFNHNIDEILNILNDCKNWIEHIDFDYNKASRVMKYFKSQRKKISDIEHEIAMIDENLNRYYIISEDKPDSFENQKYEIDHQKLIGIVKSIYSNNDIYFDENNAERAIYNDIESIASIFRLRKGKKPRNIKNAEFIFLTSNSSLANASNRYEKSEVNYSNIDYCPVCMTDTFLGTFLWHNSSAQITNVNRKK